MAGTTQLSIVRHGETDWNVEQRIQGHTDVPLNSVGMAQARAVGGFFAGQQADALYCSDLFRAQQTALPIARSLGLPMVLVPALRERNFGQFEGVSFPDLQRQSPQDYWALENRAPDYAPPQGESLRQFRARVVAWMQEVLAAHTGQRLVIVTHGGVLDIINRQARGLALKAPRDFEIPNAGINRLVVREGQWEIVSWAEQACAVKLLA